MRANRKHNRAKGFTLVEILIVVVILGILAAIVVPQFTSAADEARGGNVQTQISTLETQLELWAARNNGAYPDLVTDGWANMIAANYVKAAPRNPFAPAANATDVTANAFADPDAADAAAAAAAASDGWLYNSANGLIRAAGAPDPIP